MAAPSSTLDRTVVDPRGCAFAHWQNVAILVWRASPDGPMAKAATDFADELMLRYDKFSVVHVSETRGGLPSAEGREAFIRAARKGQDRAACVGVLLPAPGVVATMMVTFLRGVRTLLRGNMHMILEHDLKTLVRELAPAHSARSGVPISMGQLMVAIEEARALLAA